jgi:hypothetical protein
MAGFKENFDAIRQGDLLRMLTGKTGRELTDQAASGKAPYPTQPGNEDKAVHSAAMQGIASRFGQVPADILGMGNEIVGGLYSAATGKGFTGPTGFDMADLLANRYGTEAAAKADQEREAASILRAMRWGQ